MFFFLLLSGVKHEVLFIVHSKICMSRLLLTLSLLRGTNVVHTWIERGLHVYWFGKDLQHIINGCLMNGTIDTNLIHIINGTNVAYTSINYMLQIFVLYFIDMICISVKFENFAKYLYCQTYVVILRCLHDATQLLMK